MSDILMLSTDSHPPDDCFVDLDVAHNIPNKDETTQHDVEETILATITIDAALARLPVQLRVMMELLYAYRVSSGYTGAWPPTSQEIGAYLGDRFYQGHAIPVRTLWYWHTKVLAHWRRQQTGQGVTGALHSLQLSVPRPPVLRRVA